MIAQIVLDVTIVGLLSATVVYCTILSRKINHLRQGKKDMDKFLGEFNYAISKAEENIGALKEVGEEADIKLRSRIEKAHVLTNDLSFLTDKGELLAGDLEMQITANRSSARALPGRSMVNTPSRADTTSAENSALARFANGSGGGNAASKPSLPITTLKKNAAKDVRGRKPGKSNDAAIKAKKLALEEVLKQIAANKEEANKPSLASTRKRNKKPVTNVNPVVKKEKLTADKASLLSERKLAQLLKAAQQ